MCGSLSSYTTFGIGGGAKRIAIATTRGELIDNSFGSIVLGRGSNVLVSDYGYDGSVVVNRYERVDVRGATVSVGSGTRLPVLCAKVGELGLSGLEWAIGIPGTVGGAVRMNAGAFGSCIADRLVYADVLRGGRIVRLYADELGFSYRHSRLDENDVVVDAVFALGRSTAAETERAQRRFIELRAGKQPRGRSAGSVFKNPPNVSIGRLIDKLGFKGYRVGGAAVSNEHANIIVNVDGATARDVVEIIETIKTRLYDSFGIEAKEEIIYIGEFD